MKKILSIISLGILITSFTNFGTPDEIVGALKSGNATEISQYFDNFIDITLPEKDEMKNMGKNQATIALQSFFKDNGIKGFELTSQREMGASMYLAGKLQNAGKGYNITILLKTKDGDKEIITVRIN